MIKYDDSSLNVEVRGKLPLHDGLEAYAMQVSLAKPLVNFVVTNDCKINRPKKDDVGYTEFINQFIVYERGERLGSISCDIRYRGSEKDLVFEVESFRISKTRGERDKIASKDMKVALRTVKKTLIARAGEESKALIRSKLNEGILTFVSSSYNQLRWSMDVNSEAYLYVLSAYSARLNGDTQVTLPSKITSVKEVEEHDKRCAILQDALVIQKMFSDYKGYGVQALDDGGFYVVNFETKTINRYDSFYMLPDAVQSKYGVFKVLKKNEIVTTIGVKFDEGFAYVVE